ncbi:MAG: hypothetical protein NT131_08040 [Methanomassiliicoccales archaeon]|nr:hypothetical protein [Methanomassiliicoccales archaeon]
MRKLLVITIDTEVDKSQDWKVSAEGSFRSVLQGIPELLEPLFQKYRAKGTYLLSNEVMEQDDCVHVLKSLKGAELGTHLHGELVGPQRWEGAMSGRRFDDMQLSYDYDLERMKMTVLTDIFRKKFDRAPVSFRAGRFGAGPNTAKILIELGYKVDSSITPGMDWDLPEGRANHMTAPNQPYYVDETNLSKEGNSGLLEAPVTIRTRWLRRMMHFSSSSAVLRRMNRVVNGVMPAVWFRPSYHSERQMISVGQHEMKKSTDRDTVLLNMMFHSMEIVPGASPYARTAEESRALFSRVEATLSWAQQQGFEFMTLSELPSYF